MYALLFGALNKPFLAARTPFDWLSRDPAEVDKYVADPLCGFASQVQLYIDILQAVGDVTSHARQACIPKTLPIYIFRAAAIRWERALASYWGRIGPRAWST